MRLGYFILIFCVPWAIANGCIPNVKKDSKNKRYHCIRNIQTGRSHRIIIEVYS